jgi:DNA-directed RNA polymerase I subunit RPA2
MPAKYLDVVLDGRVIGGATINECNEIVKEMRRLKVIGGIEKTTEVALFPPIQMGPFPGLFVGTGMCRFIRPVQHRDTGMVEYLGPMEQPFLSIACMPEDIREETTHVELDPNNLFSLIASCTPFSDYNQSPRNMYQCQMGKQTMGSPAHSLPHRTDNKLYRIQNPQAPLVQTARHGEFKMDDYPNGTNAVVAVLSYTGFDMEDAMILNKSSYERGFGHASVYKTKIVDLKEEAERMGSKEARLRFSNQKLAPPRPNRDGTPGETVIDGSLGPDGLPHVGQWVEEGDALYSYVDELTGKEKVRIGNYLSCAGATRCREHKKHRIRSFHSQQFQPINATLVAGWEAQGDGKGLRPERQAAGCRERVYKGRKGEEGGSAEAECYLKNSEEPCDWRQVQ